MAWYCGYCKHVSADWKEHMEHPHDDTNFVPKTKFIGALNQGIDALNMPQETRPPVTLSGIRNFLDAPSFILLLNMVADPQLPTPKVEELMDYADDIEDNFIAHYWDNRSIRDATTEHWTYDSPLGEGETLA